MTSWVFGVFFAQHSRAEFRATSESGAVHTFASSTWVYYGPQEASLPEAEAVFLRGHEIEDLCRNRYNDGALISPARVKGKVVVSIPLISCKYSKIYRVLDSAGALAYVTLRFYYPSGLLTFWHDSWSTTEFDDRLTMMLDVSIGDVGEKLVKEWETTSMQGWRVQISPPYNRVYQKCFESPTWTLLMRSLLPAAAFYTSATAVLEFARLRKVLSEKDNSGNLLPARAAARRSMRITGLSIVTIEAPAMFCIGILLVLGQYGKMVLPARYHYFGYFLFSGISVVTTLMLALVVREEARMSKGKLGRDMIVKYRYAFVVIALVFVAWDIVAGHAAAFGLGTVPSILVWDALFGSFALAQAAAGVYFLRNARDFNTSLLVYVLRPRDNPRPRNERKIMRLIFWLYMSGAAMLFSTLTLGLLVAATLGAFHGAETCWDWLAGMSAFSLQRILVSYSQIQTIKPEADSAFRSLVSAFVGPCWPRARLARVR
eukprot:CAMPEP_0172602688 /NCGR_PEP_ID=MMETSP1068-20121228/22864_1 /TAXON_ID=35684 /ORGANISM="Pseudopedinella elastica, Strain CCMP716" /LENGTH=486 /DNA_ID=CAMNT_0013404127 /DNA_START=84 /DNA_END=1541 /DNA_ORIENTATION=-